MNKHFEDARYYLARAGHHVKLGFEESLEPVEAKFRDLTGRESEPEPSRIETLLEEAKSVERKAESEARETIGGARQKLESYRPAK